MESADLPGRSRDPQDLNIPDARDFLQQVPELIIRLRMRRPSMALELNLSEASLLALDRELADIINTLPDGYSRVAETIDRDLLRQVAAYVGEVIVRNRNGQWRVNSGDAVGGPKVRFPIVEGSGMPATRWKEIDIYEHVLVTILEGEALTGWYSAEVLDDTRG